MIVLDTMVVSEMMRDEPHPSVGAWVAEQRPTSLVTSALTVAEIGYGIDSLPDGARKRRLRETADSTFAVFGARILPFDLAAAERYSPIVVDRERAGRPISGFDAQIAAICASRRAVLATRNTKDFELTGVELIDPWQA